MFWQFTFGFLRGCASESELLPPPPAAAWLSSSSLASRTFAALARRSRRVAINIGCKTAYCVTYPCADNPLSATADSACWPKWMRQNRERLCLLQYTRIRRHYPTTQTIIECLKYMCTGTLPPGSHNGQSFVHDIDVGSKATAAEARQSLHISQLHRWLAKPVSRAVFVFVCPWHQARCQFCALLR